MKAVAEYLRYLILDSREFLKMFGEQFLSNGGEMQLRPEATDARDLSI